jgi:hypothetical protein
MNRRTTALSVGLSISACSLLAQRSNAQATYTLKPTPKTVALGYYDAQAKPVLRVKSGDTVEIQSLTTTSRKRLCVLFASRRE